MDTKQKIRELVPDAKEDFGLAVVLRAIQKSPQISKVVIDAYGVFWDFNTLSQSTVREHPFYWNLEKDSWDSQSAETQTFIGSLLSVSTEEHG